MRTLIAIILALFLSTYSSAQSCSDWIEIVKTQHINSSAYESEDSKAVEKVTFYEVEKDSLTYYFAIVCLTTRSTFDCKEYIYQVSNSTELYYALAYKKNPAMAYWKYIKPHNKYLNCGRAY